MNTWSHEQLERIKQSDDLHVAPFRQDGTTPGTPTWIWSVVVGDELYARAYHGRASRWFQAALAQGAGRITIVDMDLPVTFELVQDALNNQIDAAYQAKYAGHTYLAPMIRNESRSATVRIRPAG
ncbi:MULTISPECIES: DUF2255 family protein [unclassified Rhodanobacter]|uniref:DUF2255 family protein n=1 Tax=unclassified Rhodanobacter TaxID=2621553 RepID=UPI0016109E43|nr:MULTISPECIES: DUF2255 family protein [unclassified Rhodanobacter]MBB6242399.1 hypothetical protein [Rhodanobacter sp. MP1X3]MBB6246237.1 hypothetical protein [Rhodanobacter sp. A1T4]